MASKARGIQSIEVGGRLIEVLTEISRPMMLRDLAVRAGIAPAQAHAYLASYRKIELVEQDVATGMYRLGPFAMRLGMARLRSYEPLRRASEAAAELSARLGVMAVVAVWGIGVPTLIRVEESAHPVNIDSQQGTIYSVIGTITGRVLAAFSGGDEAVRQRIETEFASQGAHGGIGARTSRAQFRDATASIRKLGYAVASSLVIPEVNGISAPILDRNGRALCAITLIGNSEDLDIEVHGEPVRLLLKTTQALTERLKASADSTDATPSPSARKRNGRRTASRHGPGVDGIASPDRKAISQ